MRHNSPRIFFYSILLIASVGTPVGMCFASTGQISPTNGLPYTQLGNVTYRMELTLEVTNTGSPDFVVSVFNPLVNNWSIEVPENGSTLQASTLVGNATNGFDYANFTQRDKFNNTIDYYNKTLTNPGDSFILSMNYTVTAKQIRWDNLGTRLMSDYETATPFYKLYTQNQPPFINISDPAIIQTAAMICGGETSPVEKARKIYNYVSKNITYQVQTGEGIDGTGEMGASWALANGRGDCSEYSDLMVAFLRVQGVPARKVVGIALLDSTTGNHLPSYAEGATWNYYKEDSQASSIDNSTGHAWVEYFVQGVGWIACDPTWGNSGQDYFNYIDYLHISSCRGEYFGGEVRPTFTWLNLSPSEIGEYPLFPLIISSGLSSYILNSAILVRFTVIESNIWVDLTDVWIIIGLCLVIGIIAIIVWVARRRPKKSPLERESY